MVFEKWPAWVRFSLVLPASVGAFAAVQALLLLWGFVNGFFWEIHSWEFKWLNLVVKFLSATLPPYFAVSLGARVAPSRPFLVSVLLTGFYALLGASVVVLVATNDPNRFSDPLWWVITAGILGVAAAIFACTETRSHFSEDTGEGSFT